MTEKAKEPNTRLIVFRILNQVLENKIPLDDALEGAFRENSNLDTRDKAFVKNLATTIFRHLPFLDTTIGSFLKKPLANNALWVRHWLRIGAAQILFFKVLDHAAVDTAVEGIARSSRPGAEVFKGLVNAILRNVIRQKEDILSRFKADPEGSIPRWLRERWAAFYGVETLREMAKVLASQPPMDITCRTPENARSLAKILKAEEIYPGVLRFQAKGPVTDLPGFKVGRWWAQDLAASLPPRLLGEVKGKRVLDLCAAPGGKTLYLASRGAEVTAVDFSQTRLEKLKENLQRTGFKAEVVCEDILKFEPEKPFDLILLDAPCSATGTLRRHPDVPYHRGKEDLLRLAELQRKMLGHALGFLAPKGVLVYCVCSLEPEEGEELIAEFLNQNPEVKRLTIKADEVSGHCEWLTKEGDLKTLPCHLADKGGMDGFFAARLTR